MIDLTKENCDAEVRQETSKPVVVDFWGPQCVPCMALKPKYHEMEHEFGDKVKFTAVDCSTNKRVAMGKNGVEVKRLSKEECTEESIRAAIEELAKEA